MNYLLFSLFFIFFSEVVLDELAYDFEVASVPSEITPQTSLQLSTNRFKKGSKSLEWQWTPGQRLTWDLSSKTVKTRNNGGIKIWVYNTNRSSDQCLQICVREQPSPQTVSCFPFSLNFVGWRAAWVGYREFVGCPLSTSTPSNRLSPQYKRKIDQFFLIAPSGATSENPLYIDLLRFFTMLFRMTRDSVVPPLTYVESEQTYCTTCAKIYSGLSEIDALSRYGRTSYWHQIYRWSIRPASPEVAAEVDTTKLTAIGEITRRLVNWYANERTLFTKVPHTVSTEYPFLVHRWDSLLKTIDSARRNFKKLTNYRNILTSGLFGKRSRVGEPKKYGGPKSFSFVFFKVLLPLVMEHHIKSRPKEVKHMTCILAQKYRCSPSIGIHIDDIEAITGKDSYLRNYFNSILCRTTLISSESSEPHRSCRGVTQECFDEVESVINELSNYRKRRILNLFDYIKDQGWEMGSALGSMDHEALEMSGFAHSVFLMRNELKASKKLDDVIATMKWYMEFGEVYQTSFEFKGATADRVRSIMLYRLLTVLAMPEDNDLQRKEKIRDMDALKLWIENALSINEGLGGLIKPDFSCYHDGTFYGIASCPSALHTAALVSYMLDGTAYGLSDAKRKNLINAFKVFRLTAVRYSTPSQINGGKPQYDNAVFIKHVPAFAYMAMKPGENGADVPLNKDLAEVRMFLRLYDHVPGTCEGKLNGYLCNGKISRNDYQNTLGSLEIMARVKTFASSVTSGPLQWYYQSEQSPSGHFTKQFGALSIHRRNDWAVTVKGFDKHVWDFENPERIDENLYGMYGSHGSMLIANNEESLGSKNVDRGWDWRKIPGTTVINVNFPDMLINSDRHYNPSKNAMAGGVFFRGSKSRTEKNGVFGMNFKQPTYDVEPSSPFYDVNFRFKKSMYFYDDMIVSLGSGIQYNGGQYEVHTTLFQDLMPQSSPSTTDEATSNVYRCNVGESLRKTSWSSLAMVILVDVNGNRYYIPNPEDQGLVFGRKQSQTSVKSKEKNKQSNGVYCTAWFNHGQNPTASKTKYEYAIQVDAEPVGRSPKPLLQPANRYKVIKQGKDAHVVKFQGHNGRGTVHGYVVFPISPSTPVKVGRRGPIASVHDQSVIMVEETTSPKKLYIAVNSPQLNLAKKDGSPGWCNEGNVSPTRFSQVDETLLFCSKSIGHTVRVNLHSNNEWSGLESLEVGGKDKTNSASDYVFPAGAPTQNPLKFFNIINGGDTEVTFN